MAKRKITVTWSSSASNSFIAILEYLNSRSPMASAIVGNAILDEIEKIAQLPFGYPKDELKEGNDGNTRVCFVYSYRISFSVGEGVIYILRIRHTSREPLSF